jgi:hypothetical protein
MIPRGRKMTVAMRMAPKIIWCSPLYCRNKERVISERGLRTTDPTRGPKTVPGPPTMGRRRISMETDPPKLR